VDVDGHAELHAGALGKAEMIEVRRRRPATLDGGEPAGRPYGWSTTLIAPSCFFWKIS